MREQFVAGNKAGKYNRHAIAPLPASRARPVEDL
jgi:hypothetical protein